MMMHRKPQRTLACSLPMYAVCKDTRTWKIFKILRMDVVIYICDRAMGQE